MFSKSLLASSVLALSVSQALAAGVQFAGVNIAGFDFGCGTDGTCVVGSVDGPTQNLATNVDATGDGPGQMEHFATKDKLNIFRLPVAWQYLVNGKLGGTLDATAFAAYDGLVQGCLATGAHCIIDIHNYARWNGATIGSSGGPTNDDFSSLWKQLATKYAADNKVIMGLMNEPHDMPSMSTWAASVQAAVTAIRTAGATTQMILLPGNGYTGASTLVSSGSAAALASVTNPDGSTTALIFDVHQYLDSDGSGTSASCVKTSSVFAPLLSWLQTSKRQALLSETGGGSSDASCITNVCEVLDYLNTNSDQFLGYVGWAAGSFATSYVLSLVPNAGTDVPLMAQCFAAKFDGGAGLAGSTSPTTPASSSSTPPASTAAPAASSPATSPAPAESASSAPAAVAAPVSTTSAGGNLVLPGLLPTTTSSPVPVSTPSSSSSSSSAASGQHGTSPGSTKQPGGPDGNGSGSGDNGQDDCDAEWEDVPAPKVMVMAMGRRSGGKVRLDYGGEVEV